MYSGDVSERESLKTVIHTLNAPNYCILCNVFIMFNITYSLTIEKKNESAKYKCLYIPVSLIVNKLQLKFTTTFKKCPLEYSSFIFAVYCSTFNPA